MICWHPFIPLIPVETQYLRDRCSLRFDTNGENPHSVNSALLVKINLEVLWEQYVIFDLSDEHYGVEIAAVESIIKMQTITSVPHAPDFVEGVTNLRGEVLPVIDLRKGFWLEARADTKDTRIIVVTMNGTKVGMIVDGVSQVLTISDEATESPSPIVTTVDTSFITSIAKLDDTLIIMLELGEVLSIEERIGLQAIPAMV